MIFLRYVPRSGIAGSYHHSIFSFLRTLGVCGHQVSSVCVPLFVIPGTVACQAPLSMGFSRQEYWSGLPCPLPGDLPDPGIKSMSLMSPALAGGFFSTSTTWEVGSNSESGCVGFLPQIQAVIRYQLSVLQFTSVLTVSIQREHQILQV